MDVDHPKEEESKLANASVFCYFMNHFNNNKKTSEC